MVIQEPADSPRHWCYGCSEFNREGLQIQFHLEGKTAVGCFLARDLHQGFPGLVHGRITAAALDEAMGWAVHAAGIWAVTARMEVKYRHPLPLGQGLTVRGEVIRDRGRRVEVTAKVRSAQGEVLAEASGIFVRVPRERARQLEAFYLGRREQPRGG